ncbi:MAG TPA: hypothetical protein VNS55_07265 [Nocardioides sp.]|nr:hypothetical protein [Nocardioides sp.]
MIEAHGIGGQSDLPIPLELAVSGAVAALVLSFTVLVVAWRRPRYAGPDGIAGGRPVPAALSAVVLSPYTRVGLRVLGFVVLLFAVATAVAGVDQLTNPFFGIVYIWLWVGVAFASLLLGPVWKAISPVRTITDLLHRATGGDPEHGVRDWPTWLGVWPGALGLYAFVWLELVYDGRDTLADVRLWFAVYVAVMLVGGAVFGSRFHQHADPFEVYSTMVSRLSPWAVVDGRVVVRSPLANLATTPPSPGLAAVVGVLFGSTAFDSFSGSTFWLKAVYDAPVHATVMYNLGLLVFCLVAGLLFAVGSSLTPVGKDLQRSRLPRLLAHSMVPIIAAYIVAHYLTFLVDYGWQTLARASDPFGKGWDILGTAGLTPGYWFSYHPTLLATIKVLAVVTGHVTAAVAAHDRAIRLLPARHQITGQLPLLFTMVGFTAGGLYLLFSA